MTSTQVEGEFSWQQEKYALAAEKELGELDKNVTPRPTTTSCCLFQLFCLIHFDVFSNVHLLRPLVYSGLKSRYFTKNQLY